MSKRRASLRPTPSLENPPEDVRPTATESVAATEAREIDNRIHEIMKSEIGQGGYVRLYRRRPMEAQFKTLTPRLSLDQFSVDWVFENYGGGEYQVKAFRENHQLVKTMTWEVDPSIPMKNPHASTAPAPENAAADIIRAVADANPRETSGSGDKMLALMMAQNTALIQAIASRRESGGGDSRLLEVLLPKLLEERKTTSIDEMMKFAAFIDRAKKGDVLAAAEEEDKSPLERIAEKVMEMMAPFIAAKMAGAGGPPGTIPLPQGAASTSGDPQAVSTKIIVPQRQAAQPTIDPNKDMEMILNRFRSAALKAAADKKDPIEWTDSMLQFVPTDIHPRIFAFANTDDWFARLFQGGAQNATQHFEFLKEVRTTILTMAFANSAIAAKGTNPPTAPEFFAKQFLDWACPSCKDEFAEFVRDPEFFPEIFGGQYEPNKEWLDRLNADMQAETKAPAEASSPDGAN